MIFLVLTILQSTAIFAVMKLFTRYRIDNFQAITINYIIAVAFGLVIYRGPVSPVLIAGEPWFVYALVLGVTFIATFYIFALSAQKVGVALTSVASKMSVVIPVIAGLFLLQEQITPLAATGVALAMMAFYLTLGRGAKSSFPRKYVILPLFLFLGNGVNDTLMKYSEYRFIDDNNELILFLSIIFLTALVAGLLTGAFRHLRLPPRVSWRNILAGTILGMLNFGSTFYILKAMGEYDSAMVFPVVNAGIVTLSAMTGFLLFRERLSRANWLGILLAITAILLISNAQ